MDKLKKSALAETEERILDYWRKENVFAKSIDNRKKGERFVFYDGPPFANGLPHLGHMLTSTIKDAITRYQTMRGKYVPRRFGWDCHGLPPEMLAEKELGISGKIAINEYGVGRFVGYCRDSVLRFTSEWHEYVTRLGRWVDFADDYRTMDKDYMESVIWAFSELYKKGLIYEGERVVPYSYGAQTALSNFETRQDDSYRDREDLTATVRFKLSDGRFLLGWTTTPWTLPANLLLAVNPTLKYVEMRQGEEVLILANDALDRYEAELDGYSIARSFSGEELLNVSYTPLFNYFVGQESAFRVVGADFVEAGEGTGVVHIAPGHGEDDYWLGKNEGVPIISPVDDDGRFTNEVKDYAGRLVFDANNEIVADLEKSDQLFATTIITHKYPHCWRTDVPIIYRAMSAWFVDVNKIKQDLLTANQQINWYPEHIKDGAFGKWLENAREWNISRKRFWGAPLPVWKTDDGEIEVIGSIDELKKRAVNPELLDDLHRPNIDKVQIRTKSGKLATRIEDVFDCWFESGSMPFAQLHYPFENKDLFESAYPADFITEYVGQTRGWFYTLHIMSVALFGKPAFKNAVAHGILLGSDGRKLSKRLGNYPENETTFNTSGADSVRMYLLSTPLVSGETAVFDNRTLLEVQRNIVQRFKNVQTFYSMYADVDGYKPSTKKEQFMPKNFLDKWVLSRLNETIYSATKDADLYNTPGLIRSISGFLDDLSNWYVRRSRRRFWKSGNDADKLEAYRTLHFVLTETAKIIAPWAPFVAEDVWRSIKTAGVTDSVHLADWPVGGKVDKALIEKMRQLREAVTVGLAKRAAAGIKVRQPLSSVTINMSLPLSKDLRDIVAEELNVKEVIIHKSEELDVVLDTKIDETLRLEGLARDIIRVVQVARKSAGLNLDDRIRLALYGDSDIQSAIKAHKTYIQAETLATELTQQVSDQVYKHKEKIASHTIEIGLSVDKQG
jgi:isoleucyl-tRNA synthetase